MREDKDKKRKKKDEHDEKDNSFISQIGHDLKKSVAAILLIGVAIILVLALFEMAGPAGGYLFGGLTTVVGWGYYILPLVALVVAGVFLTSGHIQIITPTLLGAAVLILAALGLIDIIFPEKAGIVGVAMGLIERPFGYYAGLVIMFVLIVTAAVITLNIPLQVKPRDKKKKTDDEDIEEAVAEKEEEIAEQQETKEEEEEKPKEDKANIFSVKKSKKAPIFKNYVPPPLSLLKSTIEKPTAGDLRANANTIKRTMESFGIPVEMGEINIGPKFTRYTLKPAEGIKVARLTALNQDLALALAAHPIRIEAPIPGKSLVGIEVPNKAAAIVRLGSLLGYPEFINSGPLNVFLGRDVTGNPVELDIARLPHLLVAGATGSGKSVTIHTILISLIYKNSPASLKFVMIDPKKVELSVYDGIPHLVAPVVTNNKKAIGVFRWAIQEMEKRYEMLLGAGARDIDSYNNKTKDDPLPYLVVVVDELADLMSSHGKDVETAIVRLAQMARATGIHLILSTQRPSVEVITGLIKANIPGRLALQVASQIDSRTIIDCAGAEKLLGRGDMLMLNNNLSKPLRIQGAFISEQETRDVNDFIIKNNPAENTPGEENSALTPTAPTEESQILTPQPVQFDNFASEDEDDDLYDEAVQVVAEAQKASASFLQRRLKVGYARAARLLDLMEGKGVIGPGDGAKAREVFLEKPSSSIIPVDSEED